jgi:hypothetical protein
VVVCADGRWVVGSTLARESVIMATAIHVLSERSLDVGAVRHKRR